MNVEESTFLTAAAIACHNANRAHCQSIGDDSQLPWGKTPDNIKASAVDGVRKWFSGEVRTAEESHQSWLDFKKADGFTYGRVKDLAVKTHPCMVPYKDLPAEQQAKDKIFMETVLACMKVFEIHTLPY